MGQEFELKYRCTSAAFETVLRDYPGFVPITMETHYYDTFDGKLRNLRWTLRRRVENGKSICALKTPGKDNIRGEWETESTSIMAAIPKLCRDGAPMELMALGVSGLVEVCGARFTRQALTLPIPGGTVELALDKGVFLGGGREAPMLEIEIEQKSGPREATASFAAGFAARYGLEPEARSKVLRALILAAGGEI